MPRESQLNKTGGRAFDVDALWAVKRVSGPSISPDGRLACAAVTSYSAAKNDGAAEVWLYPTGFGGRAPIARPRRLAAAGTGTRPCFSPDGRHLAFAAKRGDDAQAQLYVIAIDGGEARRVTNVAAGVDAIRWFPDGKRIAFVTWVWPELDGDAAQAARAKARKEAKVKAHVTERAEYRYWDHWLTDGREPHLFACDVATGRSVDLLAGTGVALPPWDPGVEHYDIAPDGREIALTVDPESEPGMMHRCDLVVVDVRTRRTRNLTAKSGRSDEHPRYSPDGRSIAYNSYDTARAYNDQGELRVLDRASNTPRTLQASLDRATTHLGWTPDATSITALVEDRGRVGLWRLPLDGSAPVVLVQGGVVSDYERSRDASVIVFARDTNAYPPALFAARGDGSDERQLDAHNRALLARHALGDMREFTITGADGEDVQVLVTYPPDFDARRKWPLMHSIHGGPHAAHHDGWHFRWNTQVFAGQGYVVAAVNYHGSSGFGQAFLDSIPGRFGQKEYADVEAATDFLIAQDYTDSSRLVATGGSYGGFMVAYMNGHTDRYKAFVCHAGCYDWIGMMASDGYRFFEREWGAFHWDDEERVMRQSPHRYVKNAKTPTLVIHGELDYRVPAAQGLQYFNSLKAKDVPARLVYFPDENHWILKPANSRLWYREFFAWLARYAPAASQRKRATTAAKRREKAAA